MGICISTNILGLVGQRVNEIKFDERTHQFQIVCRRDRRKRAVDPVTGIQGTVNRYVSREVRDIPFMGYPCILKIELAQVFVSKNVRRMEACELVDKGNRFTRRFCRLVSGLCRHMSIQAVARHLNLRWEPACGHRRSSRSRLQISTANAL